MEAVQSLLEEAPLRAMTMEAVARRAGVSKPTLYRWWPTRSALVLAMFRERLVPGGDIPASGTAETRLRARVSRLIEQFGGAFGKVMADLIAEGQAEPALRDELYATQIKVRRGETIAEIVQGIEAGEFRHDLSPELLVDSIFGAIYYRLLLAPQTLSVEYGEALVAAALTGARAAATS